MKFWETFKEEQKKDTKHSWWHSSFFIIGLLIGAGIIVSCVGALFLALGWGFSLLWNYSVAPMTTVTDIGATQAAALLFLIFCFARFIKVFIKG